VFRYLGVDWTPPAIDLDSVETGDMPGDKIRIDRSHIDKATTIFPYLLEEVGHRGGERSVVSVYGGSGVGKSEIASLLGHYCRHRGLPAYVLSGDNYALRVPQHNDLERLRTYRTGALNAFAAGAGFSDERMATLRQMWPDMADMDPAGYPDSEAEWLSGYHRAGIETLAGYLGTDREIDFATVNAIIASFKSGAENISLKRMGQTPEDLRFESVDVSQVVVLIVEWTHGNNPLLRGVDFPIYLFSTPAETLAHRRSRGRDQNTDSPLISRTLEVEQDKLLSQVDRAALIISKDGEVLSLDEFRSRMQTQSGDGR